MKQFNSKLLLKRGVLAGLSLAMCASLTVGALLVNPEEKTVSAEENSTVISEFTSTDMTITDAPGWINGKHRNYATGEDLTTTVRYYDYALKEYPTSNVMEYVADPEDANDTVLKYYTGKGGVYKTQFTFANAVNVSDIASLTLRFYARVDKDNASKFHFFASEAVNNDDVDIYGGYTYYEYPLTVQNQWVELTFTAEDLAKFTDDTFEGFMLKTQISANGYPRDARNGDTADTQSGYILFDSIVVKEKAPKVKVGEFTSTDMTISDAPGWINGKRSQYQGYA